MPGENDDIEKREKAAADREAALAKRQAEIEASEVAAAARGTAIAEAYELGARHNMRDKVEEWLTPERRKLSGDAIAAGVRGHVLANLPDGKPLVDQRIGMSCHRLRGPLWTKPVACCGSRRRRGRVCPWCREPAYELDPGSPKHPRLRRWGWLASAESAPFRLWIPGSLRRRREVREVAMEVLYPRCAGLDVHKDTVVAAVRLTGGDGLLRREVETFATTTPGLVALSDWLERHDCPTIAMEATGVYWRPVWQVLAAEDRTLVLANATHVKNVPGRKTDVADAVWLSDLLAHGLIRPSFVPDAGTRAMRDLLRTRKQLVREQASHVQRIQKTLEDANLKLASVLTDIMGRSGRAVLAALAAGETDPDRLHALVGSRVKARPEAIRAALTGRPGPHHRFLLALHLGQIDALAAAIAAIDAEVDRDLGPFREAVALLATIPGVGELTAEVILSEIGLDMSRFPTAGHLLSWAGLCPRNDESAGKRRSTRLKKGAPWLKTALVQAAWAAVRKKQTYLQAQFQRLRGRRGPRKAICAVAASMLTAAYHMLSDGASYADPGPRHLRRSDPTTRAKALARQIERLGFRCSITGTVSI